MIRTVIRWWRRNRSVRRLGSTHPLDVTRTRNLLLHAREIQIGEHLLNHPDRFRAAGEAVFEAVVGVGTRRAEEVRQLAAVSEQAGREDEANVYWQRFLTVVTTMAVDVIRQDVFATPSRAAVATWPILILSDIGLRPRGSGPALADQIFELLKDVPLPPAGAHLVISRLVDLLTASYPPSSSPPNQRS